MTARFLTLTLKRPKLLKLKAHALIGGLLTKEGQAMKNDYYRLETSLIPPLPVNDWQFHERRGDYYIWFRDTADEMIVWNATKSNAPPNTTGGYYDLYYLLKIKGISSN